MPDSAYIAALKMLGRRELSERQVRQRLARRGYDDESIDEAIVRLRAIAALTMNGRRERWRTRRPASRSAARCGSSAGSKRPALRLPCAQRAIQETFQAIDADALLAAALQKRLRGRESIADDREFQRLYRYLIGQGFEPDRVLALLRRGTR